MSNIKIEQGNEFKIINECIKKDDLFLNEYQHAAISVEEIVTATKNYKEQKQQQKQTYKNREIFPLNNIIAFSGDRGQGKSSAMVCFADELLMENKQNSPVIFGPNTINTKFEKLDIVDPSTFENMHNIVEVVVARMYKCFEAKYFEDNSIVNKYIKNEIIDLFQKVYESLCLIRNPKKLENLENDYEGSIQKIAQIGDSTGLREYIKNLVELYLKIMTGSEKDSFLIIPIDDLDINIEYAYKIAEQIRKYLLIPNVLIVMAIKIDQLKQCIEKEYRVQLETLIKAEKRLNNNEPVDMAAKYVEKLIPDGRKINLPELRVISSHSNDDTVIIYKGRDKEGKLVENLFERYKGQGIERTILGCIYEKTRIAFVKPENSVHNIVPNTLRELVNIISIIGKMQDLSLNGAELNNLKIFENYFLYTWIPNNLDDGYVQIIREIYTENDLIKHRTLYPKLISILETWDLYTLSKKRDGEFESLKSEFGIKDSAKFSLGDIVSLLNFMESRFRNPQISNFTFALKTIYTIIMRKMVLNLTSHEEDVYSANDLYKFVGGDIWGYTLIGSELSIRNSLRYVITKIKKLDVIRAEQKVVGVHKNLSRTFFEYGINDVFNNTLPENNGYIQITNLSDEQIKKIINVVFLSKFDADQNFIHSNCVYQKQLQFSIDTILISSLDLRYLYQRCGFYALENSPSMINEANEKNFEIAKEYINNLFNQVNLKLATAIVSNVELSEYVYKYCQTKSDIKGEANGSDYYKKFLRSLESSLKDKKVDYLKLAQDLELKMFNEMDFENNFINLMVNCLEAKPRVIEVSEEADDLKSAVKTTMFSLLSKVKEATTVCRANTFATRVRAAISTLDYCKELFSTELFTDLIHRLNVLKDQCNSLYRISSKENINEEMIKDFNSIVKTIQLNINKDS